MIFNNLKIFLFTFIFLLFINSVSATLEMYGANDYASGFDPNNAYLISDLDTINPGSGTFSIKNTDVYLSGKNGLDIKLDRTYNSGVWINRINGDDYDDNVGQLKEFSYLGVGWQPFTFGILRLTENSEHFYTEGSYIEFGDGNQYRIYKEGDNLYQIKNKKKWKFFKDGDDYKLIKEDGTTYLFDHSTIHGGGQGLYSNYYSVTSITDTHGNSISIHYMPVPPQIGLYYSGGSGNENLLIPQNSRAIDYITDSLGRTIDFQYNLIQDEQYLDPQGNMHYVEHYILDKITHTNANNEIITVDYNVIPVYDGIYFPYAHTQYWASHIYILDKVEIKKGSALLKPRTYYDYNDYGELETVIYNKKSELPNSHLTQDSKVVYEYNKVKHQYSSLPDENVAGYSSRLKDRKVYDGMGNIYEWQYKYGNGNDLYYDSTNAGLTQRTFLHCDDTTSPTVINCASSIRVGPTEPGGTIINNYKQVKIIDSNNHYIVNKYYGTDSDVTTIGWDQIRDTSGLLKSSSTYDSNGIGYVDNIGDSNQINKHYENIDSGGGSGSCTCNIIGNGNINQGSYCGLAPNGDHCTGINEPTCNTILNPQYPQLIESCGCSCIGPDPQCSNGQTQLCPNQNGVCSGSFETCTNQQWPGCNTNTYINWANSQNWLYQADTETTCDDDLDNDCDSNMDCDDEDCNTSPYCSTILLNKKEYTYSFIFQQVSGLNYPYGQNYYRKKLSQEKETKYDALGNYEIYFDDYISYDDYDNLKIHKREGYSISSIRPYPNRYDIDDKFSKNNVIDYLHETNTNYRDANILNKISKNQNQFTFLVSGSLMSFGETVSETDYSYDSSTKGDLISENVIDLKNIYPDIVTEYEYDDYGNLIIETDANNNNFETRYDNGFDAYPSSGWNDEYGSESDPAWEKEYYNNGLLKQENDKNNGITKYYYDNLNRLKKVVYNGDTESQPSAEYTYYDLNNNMKVKIKRANNVYNNEIYYFYDGLGRLIQTRQQGINGNVIVSSIKYDSNNKIYKTESYEEAGSVSVYTNPNWTTLINNHHVIQYQYDALNRIVKNINFDNTYSETKYGPNWKLERDENNVKTKYNYDALNNLIGVEENYQECTDGQIKQCPLRLGICANHNQVCSNNVWPEFCDYGADYEINEFPNCNNNLDDDCDGLTDSNDPDCQTNHKCMKQVGVCENSVPSYAFQYSGSTYYYCTPNNYGLKYQSKETTCDDELDNDCDGLTDENDDCNKDITQYNYDILGNIIRVTDAQGKITEKHYDGFNRLGYNLNYDIGLMEYRYDNNGNVIEKISNNILKNSNFENLQEFWTFDSGVSLDSNSYFGENSIKTNGNYKYANQEAYILGSQEYILSLYSKAESKNLGVIIYLYDKYGNEIDPDSFSIGQGWSPGCSSTSDHHCWYSGSIPVEEEYSRIIFPYFNTPNNADSIKIGIGASATGIGYIYIDAVQLEKSIEAKPYSLIEYGYNGINKIIETSYPGLNMGD